MRDGASRSRVPWVVGCVGVVAVIVLAASVWMLLHDARPDDRVQPGTLPAPTPSTALPAVAGTLVDRVDGAWARRHAEAAGIPVRALQAYAGASLVLQQERPDCGLDWAALAAVGYVESHHGTLRGGRIDAEGRQQPTLVGPALDGTEHARIADTDDGRWDGDPTWDRAVGPMQFIPSTWRSHGADGNGDGVADPQQIDDASLAAARYLCEAGGDLTQASGWLAATAAYNRSVEYNNQVAAVTDQYRVASRSAQ